MISNSVLQVLAEERINNLHRQAEYRRLETGLRGRKSGHVLRVLATTVKHRLFTGPSLDVLEATEESLYHAEEMELSPNDLRQREAKRRLYERIATRSLLIDAENSAHQMR